MTTPRCFIIRHGETEWSLSGKHTGTSDIALTANGEKRVRATGQALIGEDRLIVPSRLRHVYVSPRTRAQRTLELLDLGFAQPYPWSSSASHTCSSPARQTEASISITPLIAEWNYGAYEGITSAQIREQRRANHQPLPWDIWTHGCPGGESPADIVRRVDELIAMIRADVHSRALEKGEPGDVLVVGHGHILRAFAMRWIGKGLEETHFIMEAGGVGTLSYEHASIDEPAVLLGGAFVVGEAEEERGK